MKILHTADLHIGKTVNGFSMLEDQKHILNQILEIIRSERPDALFIAGDVYDSPLPSAAAVELFDSFLSRAARENIKIFIISGNHDSPRRLAFGQSLMQGGGVYISPVYSGKIEPIILNDRYGPVGIYLIPFIKPAAVREALGAEGINSYEDAIAAVIEGLDIPIGRRNAALLHQFVTGAEKSGSEEMSIGELNNISASILDKFDYVALGHIHRSQKVQRDALRYSGSPLKYSFSEAGHIKSVTIAELREKGSLSVKTLPLSPLRDMRIIKGSYDETLLRENYIGTNTDDYVRVELTDETEIPDAVGRLRAVYPNIMELRYSKRECAAAALPDSPDSALPSPKEIFGEFYNIMNGSPMTEYQEKLLAEKIREIWEGEEK